MSVQVRKSFPASLELLALPKSGAFIYDNGEGLVECGRFRKLYESIKGFIFKGAFGIQDRTSSRTIGDRLVIILKQNKQTISKEQLNIIRLIAKRASALANIDVNNDHANLKAKLAKRVTKFDENQNLVEAQKSAGADVAIVVSDPPRTSIVALQNHGLSEELSEDADNAQTEKEGVFETLVVASEESGPSVRQTASPEEVHPPEVLTTNNTNIVEAKIYVEAPQIKELPTAVVPEEPVQTWGQIAMRIAKVAVPTMLAIAGIAMVGNSFSGGGYDVVDTCPAIPLMISDKAAAQTVTQRYENWTCPAVPLMITTHKVGVNVEFQKASVFDNAKKNSQNKIPEQEQSKEVVSSKISESQEYIKFIKNLNPNEDAEAKRILAWINKFDEKEYETDKKKYIKSLWRKIALSIHPDKCTNGLKSECQEAFAKMEQAAKYLTDAETVSSFEDFFRKAEKESRENMKTAQTEINKMTREELDDLVKNINIKEANINLVHQLFVASSSKENHRLLSKQQIKDLIDKTSPYHLYDLLEEEQWIKYIQDLDFSDRHQVDDQIFNILAENKYLYHLENAQVKAMLERFGLYFKYRHNSVGYVFPNLSEEQVKYFVNNLNVDDVNMLDTNEGIYQTVMHSYAKWLSDGMIKSLIDKKGLSSVCYKLSIDQFNRYIQNLDKTAISQDKLWEIKFYYQNIHKKEIPASILKAVEK